MKLPSQFITHTLESAPDASKSFLLSAKQAYGFLPNLLGGMAESPALLESYLSVAGIFNKTSLSESERQIILMTSNRINGCTYCMAAHTTISQGAKVPVGVIAALRNNTAIADNQLEALRQFTIKLVESRGRPTDSDLQALFVAGYTRKTVMEVIVGTALKVMSNYFNHIAHTPVDEVFQANAWSKISDPVTDRETPTRALVKSFYTAIARGDVASILALLHAELAWTEAEGFPYYSGTWRTPQEVVDKLLVPLARDWDGFAAVPHDFIEAGDRVVVFGLYSGTAKVTGKAMRAPFAHLWRVRDGKLASFDMYADTLLVARALV